MCEVWLSQGQSSHEGRGEGCDTCISGLFLTGMQVKFSIFFHHGGLDVVGDRFRFVRGELGSGWVYKLSIFSFSCLGGSVLVGRIASA